MIRKKFTDEFRKEAVQLALNSDLPRNQVADDLGIGHSTLGKWITEYRHADLMSGPHDDVQKELKRLRKENKVLREDMVLLTHIRAPNLRRVCILMGVQGWSKNYDKKAFKLATSGWKVDA